jgi:hypothetical protein
MKNLIAIESKTKKTGLFKQQKKAALLEQL